MLDEAEYASDTDESDEDYKPDGGDEHEVESDGEPDNDDDVDDDDKQSKRRSKKRAAVTKSPPITAKRNRASTDVETKCIEKDELDDDDDDNEDALWASFLGTAQQTVPKPATNSKQTEIQLKKTTPTTSNGSSTKTETTKPQATVTKTEQTKVVTEIFEFAGEKVEIQKEIKVSDQPSINSAANTLQEPAVSKVEAKSSSIPSFNRPKQSGGLSSVLGQLGKKNKLSVLEKSKLDWNGFKRNEGIDEELQTHNKGRDGFLERQDFLQRTDLRQFELEKSMRQATRRK